MARYKAKHRRPKGNKYTKQIWFFAFVLSSLSTTMLVRHNETVGLVTLNWWGSFARVFGIMGVLCVVYAVAIAMFTIWNLEREAENSSRFLAKRNSRRS
jgi:hypothetical protein